jgi:glycosyltransferase involved in cell wall biosynthesis
MRGPVPDISILMPVKNAGQWLQACLESIQTQSIKTWELIAVDDGSTDNSFSFLQKFSTHDNRIIAISNQGEGIIDALTTAFAFARAPFIHRMDADDIMPEHKLETLYNLARTDRNSIATGKVRYFSEAEVSNGYRHYEAWLNERCSLNDHYSWVYRECVIASANWITHRNNVDFSTLSYPEDYDMVFQWHRKRLRIQIAEAVTHLWREHEERTSRTSENYSQTSFFQLKLAQFLQLDYTKSRTLVIFGKNKKSKLIQQHLNLKGVDFHCIDLNNIAGMDELKAPRVLVAVYPGLRERKAIYDYFRARNLFMGMDWWWV